ncbi:hypothetical protein QWY93_08540 [Echinicola jeungdonensis]|uniref:GbsR/MarR family transcriptional regulator n=1 Tax=Echinicola jeungdonensis TaxID=709343 RepID=A0ABV5J2C2_9BACT|nr:hypothetical protein [Echinicola jeungdonensis]MDN3669375.1 hypothetical protein [Echinicola jeungdonensis]
MKLTAQQQEIIERIGVFFEKKGHQPILGRIMGLLLVLDEAEATFDEIKDYLSVSKSAVSNALTLLQSMNKVEYTTKPGERKRYFKLRTRDWRNDMKEDLQGIFRISSLLKEVMKARSEKNLEFNQCILEFQQFIDFMKEEMPKLIEKYDRLHTKSES